ncbi:phosphotransferase [Poriferisphaera sp. WC338]|uniref:phosphotransferase n=1 Tax=Poriferisphaera sp. WC338 TaxID=3425129 RepID=UPI003D81549A
MQENEVQNPAPDHDPLANEREVEPEWPLGHLSSAQMQSGGQGLSDSRIGLSSGSTMPALGEGAHGRLRFIADELAVVMSHYDLGIIRAVQEFPRGSRKAPKALIRTDSGLYLLKRRAKGKDDPFRVAFSHALQLHLTDQQFPLPHLIGTEADNNSMLQLHGRIYELFEYIKGTPYDSSLDATAESGRILGLYHRLTKKYQSEYEPAEGSYHNASSVKAAITTIPKTIEKLLPTQYEKQHDEIHDLISFISTAYNTASDRVIEIGMEDWPMQVVHSDWHPGNMLFRGNRVVAVIDYDAARVQQRILDIANGALQFSILGGSGDPTTWPEYLDESRYKRFMRAYESVPDTILSKAELNTIPLLMIEALIAESVIPVATTGKFVRMDGVKFLQMVKNKVTWLQQHSEKVVSLVSE